MTDIAPCPTCGKDALDGYPHRLPERFWAKVDRAPDCWEWKGWRNTGYGIFKLDGRTEYAHRLAYVEANGHIPSGLQIDHLCRNRACVNPAHLEAVTPRENALRSSSVMAAQARQTHCRRAGHPLSGANLIIEATGSRRCRECERIRGRGRWARRKK